MFDLLKELCSKDCLAGHEETLRECLTEKSSSQAQRIETDLAGNLMVYIKGRKRPQHGAILIAAPMDEVGFVLTEWGNKGCVKLTSMDSMDVKAVIGKRFHVVGRPSQKAVISLLSQHLSARSGTDTVPEMRDIQMDFGASSEEEIKNLVQLGDQVVYDYPLQSFGDGYLRGKALECRIGCYVLLRCILEAEHTYDTIYLFLSSKFIEHRGAVIAARNIDPHLVVLVDYTPAGDIPDIREPWVSTRLRQGPALAIKEYGTIYSRPLRGFIRSLAERAGIPYQFRSGMRGQSDAGHLHTYGSGALVAGVSVPVRYALTGNPILALEDVENTVSLMHRFIAEVDEDAI